MQFFGFLCWSSVSAPKYQRETWYSNVLPEAGNCLDRSQSLFNFVPQEKRLIWRPPLGWKNMGESIFHWENWPYDTQKRPKVGGNMPRVAGNWSEFFFVHYSGRRSHFSAGGMQIVLNQVFKYFSRAGVSYFYPLHFPTYSLTTFAGWPVEHCQCKNGRY